MVRGTGVGVVVGVGVAVGEMGVGVSVGGTDVGVVVGVGVAVGEMGVGVSVGGTDVGVGVGVGVAVGEMGVGVSVGGTDVGVGVGVGEIGVGVSVGGTDVGVAVGVEVGVGVAVGGTGVGVGVAVGVEVGVAVGTEVDVAVGETGTAAATSGTDADAVGTRVGGTLGVCASIVGVGSICPATGGIGVADGGGMETTPGASVSDPFGQIDHTAIITIAVPAIPSSIFLLKLSVGDSGAGGTSGFGRIFGAGRVAGDDAGSAELFLLGFSGIPRGRGVGWLGWTGGGFCLFFVFRFRGSVEGALLGDDVVTEDDAGSAELFLLGFSGIPRGRGVGWLGWTGGGFCLFFVFRFRGSVEGALFGDDVVTEDDTGPTKPAAPRMNGLRLTAQS